MATTATVQLMNTGEKFFYRSGKGTKAHASYGCIASRRSIWWGEIQAMTVAEARGQEWTGCLHCCTAEDHALLAAATAVEKPAKCKNEGIKHQGQRRLYSSCITCGKEGAVNRSTGRIRAHLPKAS